MNKHIPFLALAFAFTTAQQVAWGKTTKPRTNKTIKYSEQAADKNNHAAVNFEEQPTHKYEGFDDWPFPRWMSVRLGNFNYADIVVNEESYAKAEGPYAKALAFGGANKSVLDVKTTLQVGDDPTTEIIEAGTSGSLTTYGRSVGATSIKATITGNGGGASRAVGSLDVEVRKRKPFVCNFYFVYDSVGHRPSAQQDNVDAIISEVNNIYQKQANIVFSVGKVVPLEFDYPMHDVFGQAEEEAVRKRVAALGSTANRNVILTWRISLEGLDALGFNEYNDPFAFVGARTDNTSAGSKFYSNAAILAHEFGHSLGLPHSPRDSAQYDPSSAPFSTEERSRYGDMVMFPENQDGKRLRKDEVRYINPLP